MSHPYQHKASSSAPEPTVTPEMTSDAAERTVTPEMLADVADEIYNTAPNKFHLRTYITHNEMTTASAYEQLFIL